jgi:hypothetical protein
MASDDPEFEVESGGHHWLVPQNYRHMPLSSAWTLKSAIQALDRLDPVLPLSPGRAERHGFEYYRHGTLSLYGALNTQTGRGAG